MDCVGLTFGMFASITVVLCGPSEDDDDEEEMREARSILSTSLSEGLIMRRF